jgi:rare lipoprotein A
MGLRAQPNYAQTLIILLVMSYSSSTVSANDARAQSGIASIYAYKSGRTASGEHAHPHRFTAAHRSLPFGTKVRVTNRRNGQSVVVRINDRGPFVRGRVIDVTPAVARALRFSGLAPVALAVLN